MLSARICVKGRVMLNVKQNSGPKALALVLLMSVVQPALAEEQQQWIKDFLKRLEKAQPSVSYLGARLPDPTSETTDTLISEQTIANINVAIAKYKAIHSRGGWPKIAGTKTMRIGDSHSRVVTLRRRLSATGDLTGQYLKLNDRNFTSRLGEAVKRFQRRHGLTPSGRVNRLTRKALNVSSRQRLDQLLRSRRELKRLLAKTKQRNYVIVNIPAYELQAVRDGKVELVSRTVVGKPQTPTPVLSAKIRALNIMPYWHVPRSVVRRNLLPAIKRNPNYLVENRIRAFSPKTGAPINPHSRHTRRASPAQATFRQDPGPNNALGLL